MSYTPGIYPSIPNWDYHADPALGSTSLKTLATKTPAHWKWDSMHSVHKTEFDIGTAAHSLILEQDESGIEVLEFSDYRTKAAQEAKKEAYAAGKTPLLAEQWDEVRRVRDSVMSHPDASLAFTGHKAEHSVFWDEDGLMLKCRPDAWLPDLLVDLKTSVTADPRDLRKRALDMGWHNSAAHYIDGVKAMTGRELPFVFVTVEKTAPYLVSVIELAPSFVALGREANTRAKAIYRRCAAADEWPGYPEIEPLTAPRWAETKEILDV